MQLKTGVWVSLMMLDNIRTNSYAHQAFVPVTWNDEDISTLAWEETFMTNEIPENDSWNTYATHKKLKLEELYNSWSVPKEGTKHYMSIRPDLTDNLKHILTPYNNLSFNYNFLKLTPGCQLTWHFDTYATFVKFNDIPEEKSSKIRRTIIMMNDWDVGQIFQVGQTVFHHWSVGDTFSWQGEAWHGMCNFGPSDIIISQITYLED